MTAIAAPARSRSVARLLRGIRTRPQAAIAFAFLVLVVIAALFAPQLAPHDPTAQSLRMRLLPPWPLPGNVPAHPLGTDPLGRDLLSRVLFGASISLLVGVGAVALQATIGVIIGLVAGFYRGWADQLAMRIADVQQSVPFLVIVVAVAAVVGQTVEGSGISASCVLTHGDAICPPRAAHVP